VFLGPTRVRMQPAAGCSYSAPLAARTISTGAACTTMTIGWGGGGGTAALAYSFKLKLAYSQFSYALPTTVTR